MKTQEPLVHLKKYKRHSIDLAIVLGSQETASAALYATVNDPGIGIPLDSQ